MFGPIDRLLHPRSKRELDGVESAGPEPQLHTVDGPGLARRLGMNFRQPEEWLPGVRPGDGSFGISKAELQDMIDERNGR
jgi:hypothetical protein